MAEVAHEPSGPASPERGDTAPQQASQPHSPDRGKLRVFISYSRDDLEFADQLDAALNAYGFECVIDRHGISGGEDWKRRLGNLISEADTVVFVLSPTSARSEICAWEAEEATRLGKRILPVNWRPLEGASPPSQLRERNYIFFHADPKAAPGAGFGTGLANLTAALNTDFDWLREHTRYLQRATEWDRGGQPANRLLSGDDIAEAKAWAAHRPKNAPEPTALHLDFIRASEEEAQARSSAQRKQLEAMAAALKTAEEQKALAEQQKAVMEKQKEQSDHMLTSATNIIVRVQKQIDNDTMKEAFAIFQTGADLGYANSMANLAHTYRDGKGVAQDYAKAREWFEKAAAKDSDSAMYNLGRLYENGQGVAQDYAKAREWYEKAAAKDSDSAMVSLGVLYENGQGVAQDYAKAREWYEKAAAQDSAGAMVVLGLLYENGKGVAQDYAEAREWFAKAADKGEAKGMRGLGLLYWNGQGVAQDQIKAREWFEKAAVRDDASAMRNLGVLYENGKGVAQDYAKAREWYEKAAARDEASAMLDLGLLYVSGLGVAQDYAKAREWYEKAAARDEASAMLDLGLLYVSGLGVAQDYATAREWFGKAAAKDNTDAMVNLGLQYQNGLGVVQDYAKAREWFGKAAAKDNTYAMVNLGLQYQNGLGVAQHYAKAREWLEKAADKDNTNARTLLEQLAITEAFGAGRHPEALKLQEALAVKVEEAEIKRDGKPGNETVQALNNVTWYALFARDFPKALTAAERAHALLPDELKIEGNRAHALMFLERGEDSKSLSGEIMRDCIAFSA